MENLVEFQKIRIEALEAEVERLHIFINSIEADTEVFVAKIINILKEKKNE